MKEEDFLSCPDCGTYLEWRRDGFQCLCCDWTYEAKQEVIARLESLATALKNHTEDNTAGYPEYVHDRIPYYGEGE